MLAPASLVTSFALLSSVSAQTRSLVVPAGRGYENQPGVTNLEVSGTWGLQPSVVQQLFWPPFALGRIDAIALRRGTWSTNAPSTNIPVQVQMGYSDYEPKTKPSRFDAVASGPMQLVMANNVNLPGPGVWTPTFDFRLPSAAPFTYDASRGNLLIEIDLGFFWVGPNGRMFFDAHTEDDPSLVRGTATSIAGQPHIGCSSVPQLPVFAWLLEPEHAAPGGTLVTRASPYPLPLTAAVNLLGIARLPAPLDLGAFGAPGCRLAIAPLLAVPVATYNDPPMQMKATSAHYFIPFSARPGTRLYTQFLALDPTANAGGLSVSYALEITLGRLGNNFPPIQAHVGTRSYPLGSSMGAGTRGFLMELTGAF